MELKDRAELHWSGPTYYRIVHAPDGAEVTCTLTTGWLGRSWLLCEKALARVGDIWPVEFEPGPGVEIGSVTERELRDFLLEGR